MNELSFFLRYIITIFTKTVVKIMNHTSPNTCVDNYCPYIIQKATCDTYDTVNMFKRTSIIVYSLKRGCLYCNIYFNMYNI